MSSHTRVMRARRHAGLTQQALAQLVGVHRSAVAQWERADGSMPTVDNLARIAVATSVQFEWLATGRGRMGFASDIVPGDESPGVLLAYSAFDEVEARALMALRRLKQSDIIAIVGMIEALGGLKRVSLERVLPRVG
jgi:transcriptional regulator with XRE-family HTH domain